MGHTADNAGWRLVLGIGTTTFMGMLGLAYLVWMTVTL
jgi:hypothetical protein